jgi:hypothetical protein
MFYYIGKWFQSCCYCCEDVPTENVNDVHGNEVDRVNVLSHRETTDEEMRIVVENALDIDHSDTEVYSNETPYEIHIYGNNGNNGYRAQ